MKKRQRFKGYDIIDTCPEDGWLKGYFYASEDDIKNTERTATKAYRDMGALTHKDHLLHLLHVEQGDKILDIGCAEGAMMVYCGLLGAEVYGIDLDFGSVAQANKYLAKFGLKGEASCADATVLDFPRGFFDKVVSSDFFEHLDSQNNILVLKEAYKVLKPGGSMVIKTPNLTYLKLSKLIKQILRLFTFRNPFNVLIPHTEGCNPQHIGLSNKMKMAGIIKSAGFLNFEFTHSRNSKIERACYALSEGLSQIPFIRDFVTEEIIVTIYKPIIMSFFP